MQDDDRPFPSLDIPDHPTELELRLAEYDWSTPRAAIEPDIDEIRQALAVLSVVDMEDDEDYERYGSVWVH